MALRGLALPSGGRRANMKKNAKPAERWNPWLWAWVGSEDVASAHRLLMEKAGTIDEHGVFFCNGDDTTALEPTRDLLARFNPGLLGVTSDLDGHASILSNRRLQETVGWRHKSSWR